MAATAQRSDRDLIEEEVSPVPVPRPEDRPTLRLWPDVGRWLGLSRSATYEAAARGEIPTCKFGRRVVVPTAAFRRLLDLD